LIFFLFSCKLPWTIRAGNHATKIHTRLTFHVQV